MEWKEYKIRWIVNIVQIGERGKRSISLGFCEKQKKVAFISILGVENAAEFVKPFIIRDVYVNDQCEDARYCWNLECLHNRATPKTLQKYLGKNCDSQTFKLVSDRLQGIGKRFISKINWGSDGALAYSEPPLILCLKRKRATK